MRLRLLTALALLATAPRLAAADDVIVVPFGGDIDGDRAPVARQLAAIAVEVLKLAPSTIAQLAQGTRADILALAACPTAARTCIGQLASSLDVDRAITGIVSIDGAQLTVALTQIRRDGSVTRHQIDAVGSSDDQRLERFRAELRAALGGGTPPESRPPEAAADASPPPTAAALAPGGPRSPPGMTHAPPGATADVPNPPPDGAVRPHTWAVIGVAALNLGLGTAFLIKADRTEKAIMDAPTRTADDIRALRALEERGDTEKTTGVALLVISGVAAVAGGVLLAWDLSRSPPPSLAIAPSSGGGLAVSYGGRF